MDYSVDVICLIGKPEFKYIGNMHGNEPIGKEMLLRLVVYLCDAYLSGDELVTYLLSHTRVHIMPTMNPDGWQKAYNEFEVCSREAYLSVLLLVCAIVYLSMPC